MNNPRKPRTAITVSVQGGFTLLELILVVFIMGTLATISMSFIESEDSQWRYDESLRKMDIVRDAVLKVRDYKSQQIMSGFVFDNGGLPPVATSSIKIQPLIDTGNWYGTAPNTWAAYGLQVPNYKSSQVEFSLPDEIKYKLFKGYRKHYLPPSSLDSENKFLDGWGIEFDISLTTNTYRYTLTDKLSDNLTPKLTGFSSPLSFQVEPDDWSVPLDQLSFSLTKLTELDDDIETELDDSIEQNHTVAILVYSNSVNSNKWHTYSFDLSQNELSSGESRLFGSGGEAIQWEKNGALIDGYTRIPVGKHLFVIVNESTPTILNQVHHMIFSRSSIPTINLTFGA
jgi:prepilin-type N-terminal cleavage/methylation domain-containing protein